VSNNIRVELNSDGVRELLKSPEMMGLCKNIANGIAGRAGDGYMVTTYTGTNRVNASVYAVTEEARRDNLKNNTLLKAVKG
jgi:hypothetical protein